MPEISVIMPAFNVEKYIEKSLICLKNQTFSDFEVIIVNDGSTDRTEDICNMFAHEDLRFKVYTKVNEGVSAARNYGLDRISGNYMTFVDSDDWVTEDYLEYLLDLIRTDESAQISMTIGKDICETEDMVDEPETKREVLSTSDVVKKMLIRDTYQHANWGKLYKTSVWNDVRFTPGVIYDDYDTTYKAFSNSTKVVCGNAVKYSYVQRIGSLMHADCSEKTLSVLDVADSTTEYLIKTWPENSVHAKDMQAATYLKNLQAILNKGSDYFPEQQKRIMNTIRSIAVELLFSRVTPIKDKVKILLAMTSKRLFLKLYNLWDGNIAVEG